MIKMTSLKTGPVGVNTYIVYDNDTNKGFIVDPGGNEDKILSKINELGIEVKDILLTHGHFDHIWGLNEVKELSGAKVYAYELEKELLNSEKMNVSKGAGRPYTADADIYLKDGETVSAADIFKLSSP